MRQAIISVAYDLQLSDVKTSNGRRTIDLAAGTATVLGEWRKRRDEEHRMLGTSRRRDELVFCYADGKPTHPDVFSQTFDRSVARSGLPSITLHDLRHSHATLLLKAGEPVKVVSERLGHSNPSFTMTVYQHVLPGMQAEAAAKFAELMGAEAV